MLQVKVLVVDQDPASTLHLRNRLHSLGYQILAVIHSVHEAVKRVKQEQPQIIFINTQPGRGENIPEIVEDLTTFEIPIILIVNEKDKNTLESLAETIPIDWVVKPVMDAEIEAVVKLALYRHQTQKTIQEQQQQLKAVLHSTGEGFITFDIHSNIGYMNMIAEMMTGWRQDEAFGKKLSEVFTIVDEGSQARIDISELIAKRAKTGPLTKFSITLISREGNQTPVRARVSPIRDHAGNMYGGVISFGNISELQQAIQQARLHNQRAEALLGTIAKLNSTLDLDSVLLALLEETTSIMGIEGAVVVLLEDDGLTYQIVATYSENDYLHKYKGYKFKLDNQLRDNPNEDIRPVLAISDIKNLSDYPFYRILTEENIQSVALANLEHENHLLGVLAILSKDKSPEYSEDELTFLKGLADQASLAITNARLFENVRDSRFRLQYLSKRLVEVQEAERRSMARELHDQVGQMLTGLQFSLESGKRKVSSDAKIYFEEAQEIVSGLIKQVRDLSLRLLPSMLDDMGLLPTLQWHFEQYTNQTGIQINFLHTGLEDKRLPQNIEITAYRIIQEGLTNAARYAQVGHVDVSADIDGSIVQIKICDQGKGFDPEKTVAAKQSFGLIGMRERVMLIGGKLNVNSAPGKGTQLEAFLPLGNYLERRKRAR